MLQFIFSWYRKLKQSRRNEKQRLYNCGYAFASAELHYKGRTAAIALQRYAQKERDFGTYSAFDVGVQAAIAEWERING